MERFPRVAPDGLRRSAFHAGTADVVTFIWDGDDLLNERIEEANAARYAVLSGEVLSEKRGASRYRFVPDPLGSVRALLDTSGSSTATRDYWPYGEVAAQSGGMTSLQFVGALGYFTDTTGRIYVRARHYRPDLGRWVTVDPIGFAGGDLNVYLYVRGGPTGHVDPLGTFCHIHWGTGRKPSWAVDRKRKPCDPQHEQADLRLQLYFQTCMMECECYGQAHQGCSARFENTNWSRGACGSKVDPGSDHGGSNRVAETHCVGFWCCQAYTFYGPAYNQQGGCMQLCTDTHEYSHRQDCRSNDPTRGGDAATECSAYRASIACILRFLHSLGGSSIGPVAPVSRLAIDPNHEQGTGP